MQQPPPLPAPLPLGPTSLSVEEQNVKNSIMRLDDKLKSTVQACFLFVIVFISYLI